MIEHMWSVICMDSIIDQDTNSLTIFKVLDGVTLEEYQEDKEQRIDLTFHIVSSFVRYDSESPSTGFVRYRWVYPNGEETTNVETKIDLSEHTSFRVRVVVQGLNIKGLGINKLLVDLKHDSKGKFKTVGIAKLPVSVKN